MQTLSLQMNFTPSTNIFPIHRRIKNQAFSHNTPPNTPAETTPEKEVVSIFLTSETKETQGRTRVTPSTHLILGNKSIPKHQPKNKRMLRDCQRKPDKLIPLNLWQSLSKVIPGLSTRVLSSWRPPNRKILSANMDFRKPTLYMYQTVRSGTRPIPSSFLNNGRHLRANCTASIINHPIAILIKETTLRMPHIIPQKNLSAISNFEAQKLLSYTSKFQQFPPTPRAIMGDGYLPKTSPLQQIIFNPGHP
jgi:hypothetical protein